VGRLAIVLSRRQFLVWGLGSTGIAIVAGACSSGGDSESPQSTQSPASGDDFSARFAEFEVADEPNGDLAMVAWPDFLEGAEGTEVRELYDFQITHGEVTRYMPCFCGCGMSAGHRNNRDCYVAAVHADGSVEFDSMAPT
jgi:hypothetical protein